MLGDRVNIYPVKGYSITVDLDDAAAARPRPWVSLLDDKRQDRHQPLGRRPLPGRRHGRVQRREPRHPRRPHPAAGRLDPSSCFPTRRAPASVVPWAGLRPMTPNMMPRVGAGRRPGVFYNTGHGHLGWTLSAATAQAVSEKIAAAMPFDLPAAGLRNAA